MAARNFKPKASSNIIEGATPVAEAEETIPTVNEEDSVTVVTTEVSPVEETKETTPVVTFEDKSPKTPIEKNVKVRLKTDHSCTIGGVRYHFVKGKHTNVPESVKSILLQADLLMPL